MCHAAAMDASGRLLLAGVNSYMDGNGKASSRFVVARLTAQGAPDTTFNGTGYVTTEVGDTQVHRSGAFSIAIQPDGRIVLTGVAGYNAGGLITEADEFWALRTPQKTLHARLVVARLTATGARDTTFGTGGVLWSALDSTVAVGQAIRLLPDGRMWIGGEVEDIASMKRGFLACVTATGALDTTFETKGFGLLPTGIGGPSAVHALLLQPDGRLVGGGEMFVSPTGSDFALFRLP